MAVDRRLVGYSGMRLDCAHLRSVESAVSFDFDMLCRGMMTGINQPYLINGFDIQIPNAAINASELTVTVAGATLLHSSATQSGTILNVPTTQADEVLSPSNPNVIGSFQAGTLNYVGLDYTRMTDPSTVDQTAGWSPSQQLEFHVLFRSGISFSISFTSRLLASRRICLFGLWLRPTPEPFNTSQSVRRISGVSVQAEPIRTLTIRFNGAG